MGGSATGGGWRNQGNSCKQPYTASWATVVSHLPGVEHLKVVELRSLARRIATFPLKGRDVARAGRDELLAAFRALNNG
mgnify:CR=1 FL=1